MSDEEIQKMQRVRNARQCTKNKKKRIKNFQKIGLYQNVCIMIYGLIKFDGTVEFGAISNPVQAISLLIYRKL